MTKDNKSFRKNDFVLIGVLLAVPLFLFLFQWTQGNNGEQQVVITLNGEILQTVDLYHDQIIVIDQAEVYNKIIIQEGSVQIEEANCPDQLCVHARPIIRTYQQIVCLPNRVVVEIKGGQEQVFDAITE